MLVHVIMVNVAVPTVKERKEKEGRSFPTGKVIPGGDSWGGSVGESSHNHTTEKNNDSETTIQGSYKQLEWKSFYTLG